MLDDIENPMVLGRGRDSRIDMDAPECPTCSQDMTPCTEDRGLRHGWRCVECKITEWED